jgi:hypothetical protein
MLDLVALIATARMQAQYTILATSRESYSWASGVA